jgi:succinyldiaminopimelate transaminase
VTIPVSPILQSLAAYPFVRLREAAERAEARGIELIDFGTGDPREPTDERIRRAVGESVPELSSYPLAIGLPELREAIARWLGRRFSVEVDPHRELIPTLGSKEAIFSFAQVVLGEKRLVVVTEPGYPVAERGAAFAGGEVLRVPLREDTGWLPDLETVDGRWDEIAIFWLNYPNNPTGATAPRELYQELARRAERHGFLLASDEAYSEVWFDAPPASALQTRNPNVVVFNTLSKRSSMTGYRSGFVAASPEVIDALRAYRPQIGTAPQEFVQRASIVAWDDEEHVERVRAVYREKRDVLLPVLRRKGLRVSGSEATFFLWFAVPGSEPSEDFAARLLEHGLVITPGSYFGASGEGYARLALVPTIDECRRAAEILGEVL